MGTWYDLPPEIHDHILKYFCFDVILEYCGKMPASAHLLQYDHSRLTLDDVPRSFKNFSSALRTCRSFRYSILSTIKIGGQRTLPGVRPVEFLSSLARCKLHSLLKYQPLPIGGLTAFAGIFWKNPSISSDVLFMWNIMSSLAHESLASLLPHLGEWLVTHSIRVSDGNGARNVLYAVHLEADGRNSATTVVFRAGSYVKRDITRSALFGYPDLPVICSLNGLYYGSEYLKAEDPKWYFSGRYTTTNRGFASRQAKMNKQLLEDFPVFREIHNSEPDTWWLIKLMDHWYVVDYGGKRMLGGSCKPVMCYWDDVWDSTTWKLGLEGQEYGRDWFHCPDLNYIEGDNEDQGDTGGTGAIDEDT